MREIYCHAGRQRVDGGRTVLELKRVRLGNKDSPEVDMADIPSGLQVLVVEADRVFAASLALKYGLRGHYAQFAHSGCEALELMSRFEPSLAIVGTQLPDVSGEDLVRMIQARFPACWVVFLSDQATAKRLSRTTLPGSCGLEVLIKSVHPETVFNEVSQLVPAP